MHRRERSDTSWWRDWPLDRDDGATLAVAFVTVVVVGSLVGRMLYDWFAPNGLTDLDERIATWLLENRDQDLNGSLEWGGRLSDTVPKAVVSLLVAAASMVAWRRWREALLIGISLVFEAASFITITTIAQRPRPDLPALETSPVATSFPSGHIAAATVYGAFAIIVFWHTRSRRARTLAVVATVAVVTVVAVSRVYEAAHFPSDAVGGVILGLVSLAVAVRVLGEPADAATRIEAGDDEGPPAQIGPPGSLRSAS
ncbi:phosphatase PAP2 family protein [Ilumatobacter sp.]|uniref:phosphatase PAP2 family protein n=1 Tax=Ilumatobacter sp. TaxID=1967498 RepID=UPI003B5253EC